MSEDVALATQEAGTVRRSQPALHSRPWRSALLILIALAIAWEAAKAVFSISDQKLPHLAAIVGDVLRRAPAAATARSWP